MILNYKQDLDLGGLNARNRVQHRQHLIIILQRAMFNKKEKKGPRSAQKRQVLIHQVVEDNFSLEGTLKMTQKGKEIKVHFPFVMDNFVSARPLNVLIICSISCTSGSHNSSFWLFV